MLPTAAPRWQRKDDVNLLVPVDGSAAALRACHLISAYAGDRKGIQLTLLNVQHRPVRTWPEAALHQAAVESALVQQGEEQVQQAGMLLADSGFAVKPMVTLGQPAERILEVADTVGAKAIVMGAGRPGILAGHALGSVALRVASAALCPVVLVPEGARLPERWGQRLRVTVPVDGSALAMGAVQRLLECRATLGELIVDLVHFRAGLSLAGAVMPPHDDVLRNWSGSESEAALDTAAREFDRAGIACCVHSVAGDPATGIAEFAKSHRAEAVVMATRGRGVVQKIVLGSVALRTAQASDVPVVFMRPASDA
jgi:nucleotide-binding universal stress UspA family protein